MIDIADDGGDLIINPESQIGLYVTIVALAALVAWLLLSKKGNS
jgi:hypothetical protein